mgnify:CR=1
MLSCHKQLVKTLQEKLGFSNYALAWLSFIKGLIFGLAIYHIFLK